MRIKRAYFHFLSPRIERQRYQRLTWRYYFQILCNLSMNSHAAKWLRVRRHKKSMEKLYEKDCLFVKNEQILKDIPSWCYMVWFVKKSAPTLVSTIVFSADSSLFITLFDAWLCSILYLAYDMHIHYLTFMGRNLENKKKWTPIWMLNSACMNSKYIVNNVGICNQGVATSSISNEDT